MRRIVCGLAVVGLVAACGGGAESTTTTLAGTTTTVAVWTAEDLAATLLTPEDLGADWAYSDVDGDGQLDPVGVVTEEMRGLLPGFGFCPEAGPEVQTVAENLTWQAFTQIEFAGEGPGVEGRFAPNISVQEFLLAGSPVDVGGWFEVLARASRACAGIEWEMDDGTVIRSESMPVPSLGEAVFGELASIPVPGGRRWDIRSVTVVDGDVLMVVVEGEAGIGAEAESVVSQEELDRIVSVAHEKLAG